MLPCSLLPCCPWSVSCRLWSFPRRCMSLLPAACCWKSGACWLSRVACRLLFAAYCTLRATCCLEVVCCTLHVVCCIFPVAYCMLSVVCCPVSSGRRRHAVRLIVSACPFFVACRTFSVAYGLLPVARPTVPCRMVCAVRRLSHVASRHVACYCVASRLSHVADLTSPVACCRLAGACPILHVVCRIPPVACCRLAQRIHTRSASQRRSQLSASAAGEPRCSADRGARACVCAWVASVTVCLCGLLCVRREHSRQGNRINERPLSACLRS
jgi:hypothetical protein